MRETTAMIVDDEQLVLNNLKYLLQQCPGMRVVFETTDPRKAVEAVKTQTAVDVVFMDISMPEMDGIEAARQIYAANPAVRIIFLTAYSEYALSAFETNAVDYILKPVTPRRLARSLSKLEQMLCNERAVPDAAAAVREPPADDLTKFIGFANNQYFVIDIDKGHYLKVEDRSVLLYTREGVYRVKHTLGYWEKQLEGRHWVRCSCAVLINIDHIEAFTPMSNSTYILRMENSDEDISVSRTYLEQFRRMLHI